GVLLRWDGAGTTFSLLNPPTRGTIYNASWGKDYWLVSSGSNLLKATNALEFTDITEKLTKANLIGPPRSLIFANNFWFLNPGGTLAIFDGENIIDQGGVLSDFPGRGVNILGADEEKLLVAGPVSLAEKGLNIFTFNHGEKIPSDGFKKWSLSLGVGEKTVYVKFSDGKSNWSKVYSASITLVEAGRISGIKEGL
ncbi:MAG: hypothetical protein Q8N98_03555, partial [bacterium]|nr:hypothetical protein [bacterium]